MRAALLAYCLPRSLAPGLLILPASCVVSALLFPYEYYSCVIHSLSRRDAAASMLSGFLRLTYLPGVDRMLTTGSARVGSRSCSCRGGSTKAAVNFRVNFDSFLFCCSSVAATARSALSISLERFYNLFRFFLFIYALRGFLYIFLYSYIALYCRATGSENAAHT